MMITDFTCGHETARELRLKDYSTFHRNSTHIPFLTKLKDTLVPNGLPETAASIAVAATVVGAAATLLARRTKSIEKAEVYANTYILLKTKSAFLTGC